MLALILTLALTLTTPCATEDSSNCYWDAARGNGTGHSFVDIGGTAYYLP